MMKIFCLAFLISFNASAQSDLDFSKRFVESEDRWVAFQKEKDSSYAFGFIYIDAQAGLTLNYEGKFTISTNGEYIPTRLETASMKVRLSPNAVKVAFIPANKFKQLKIVPVPEWLSIYKGDTTSIERLYRWGYLYNEWNECAKALSYLEKAQKINADFKGLITELAFSYNCIGKYESATILLKDALKKDPLNAYTHKELIYSQMKAGDLKAASESCEIAIKKCTDTSYHGESCYNLVYSYFAEKDKKNFNKWLPIAKTWNSKEPTLLKNMDSMAAQLEKL